MILESSAQQTITPAMVQKFARTARERIRIEGGGYRRGHLRALAQKINRGTVGVGTVGGAMLLALAGCDDAAITSKDVGPLWPFTVSEVRVVCAPALAIFITADGKAYPLNGQAERHPDLFKNGPLSKLNNIWKVDPQISKLSPDTRMSLDAFTQKAIEACAKAGKWDPAKV